MSSPEDKKIDFEKLSLSEDLAGSLEPIGNGAGEQPLPEQELQPEAKIEPEPALEEKLPTLEELTGPEGAEAPAPSKLKALINKLSVADPFNVMLVIAAAALFIAILCCLVELGRYGFHISAKQARSTVTMSAPVESFRSIR